MPDDISPLNHRGRFTREEIFSQPQAWEAALSILVAQQAQISLIWETTHYDQVVFTGCGSTYYLSLAAASVTQEMTGRSCRGLPASEIWLNPQSALPVEGTILMVAVSRSGATTETLKACKAFKQSKRGPLVTLSCYPDQPLATLGDLNIVLPSGAEQSVAQTRAFTTLYLGTLFLSAIWSGNEETLDQINILPECGRQVMDEYLPLARRLGQDLNLERFYFLGSGIYYGLACEISLKMKEMTLSHSEPFNFMEFRHGPMSMVDSQTLLVGLVSERNHSQELRVLEQMQKKGAKIMAIGPHVAEAALDFPIMDQARGRAVFTARATPGFRTFHCERFESRPAPQPVVSRFLRRVNFIFVVHQFNLRIF